MVNFRNLSYFGWQIDDELGANSPYGNLFMSWLSPHMRMDFLRSGSFLAESSLCVTSSKSRNPKGFTTKRGQWSKNSWENIRIFTFCH